MEPASISPLSERLLNEKERLGSYQKLAAVLGFSVAQVHAWATGGGEPTLTNLRKIAERLGCRVVDLIELEAS